MQDNKQRSVALELINTALAAIPDFRVSETSVGLKTRVTTPVVSISYGKSVRAPADQQVALYKQSADLLVALHTDARKGARGQEEAIEKVLNAIDAVANEVGRGFEIFVAETECGVPIEGPALVAVVTCRVNMGASSV